MGAQKETRFGTTFHLRLAPRWPKPLGFLGHMGCPNSPQNGFLKNCLGTQSAQDSLSENVIPDWLQTHYRGVRGTRPHAALALHPPCIHPDLQQGIVEQGQAPPDHTSINRQVVLLQHRAQTAEVLLSNAVLKLPLDRRAQAHGPRILVLGCAGRQRAGGQTGWTERVGHPVGRCVTPPVGKPK